MPLTLADYQSLFKAYLQADRDTEDQYYPDADITAFLNSAQYDVARELGATNNFFRATNTQDLTTGDMALPDDFFGNLKAQIIDVNGFPRSLFIQQADRMDEMQPFWRSTQPTNYPTWLVINWGTTGPAVQAWPQPVTTMTDALFLSYTAKPTEMEAADDESEVMANLQELQRTLLPFGALRDALLFEAGEADDQVKKYTALYARELQRARFAINSMFPASYKYGMGP